MTYKMIVTDMDGTCLNGEGKLSEVTKRTLIEAQKKGIMLVLASGRSSKSLSVMAHDLCMDQYSGQLICVNGMSIKNCTTGSEEIIRQMHKDEQIEVYNFVKDMGVEIFAVLDNALYNFIPESMMELKRQYRIDNNIADDVPWTGGVFGYVMDHRHNYEINQQVTGVHEYPEIVNKLTMCHTPEKIEEVMKACIAKFGDKYSFIRTSPIWLECMPEGVSKGSGIRRIQEEYNIAKEETLVFGDGENDLSMLSEGYAMVMANGMKTVLEHADEIALSNLEDGVAKAVQEKILNQL